jgi:hypothetical protein
MLKLSFRIAALTLAFASPLLAQTSTPGIDKRESIQEKRIEQGVKSGALTNKEASKLEVGQTKVEKMEEKAKADGKVTKREHRRIHQEQNKQSQRIYKKKHNQQHN